ncbi:hypothetical protein [Massilia sp. TS11]|uniref:hypothetical protein n=1 Tax=Massilia sp. TS11 TaxID=2908003 RepID=UPI001EDAC4DF|nr:hypothetical protein [Massilia sp. TS11]MCG2584305.1 hypothetical protein [Massilia sp. TS11]
MLARLTHWYHTAQTVMRLPVAQLHFDSRLNPREVPMTYQRFMAPHPRYKIIPHKTIGVALLDLRDHGDPARYLSWLKKRYNSVAAARKARGLGYVTQPIDRNAYVEDIFAINTSLNERQGRPMAEHYQRKTQHFEVEPNFRYLGVLDSGGRLSAYCNMGFYGNFAAFSQVMGYRNNDGAMHLLIIDVICQLLEEGRVDYLMYDTYFGALPGMQRFKSMFGFTPYRVRYSLS